MLDVVDRSFVSVNDTVKISRLPVPESVLNRSNWPLWRRVSGLADSRTAVRIEGWRALEDALHHFKGAKPEKNVSLQSTRDAGIFGSSRAYWQNMFGSEIASTKFYGSVWTASGVRRVPLKNPHSPLMTTVSFDEFECDLRDIEGICASKSSERHFDTVDEFGRDFCEYERVTPSTRSLAEMLEWSEVRLMRKSSSDRFSIDLYDGRLFIDNAGGSHHLAGAIHIALETNTEVRVKARLRVHGFNPHALQWMLDRYRILLAPSESKYWSHYNIAMILGECFTQELAPVVGDGTLVLLPKTARGVDDVAAALKTMGAVEESGYFGALLREQSDVCLKLAAKWPVLSNLKQAFC